MVCHQQFSVDGKVGYGENTWVVQHGLIDLLQLFLGGIGGIEDGTDGKHMWRHIHKQVLVSVRSRQDSS